MPLCHQLALLLRSTHVDDMFHGTSLGPFTLTSTNSPINPPRSLICCRPLRCSPAACLLLAWTMVRLLSSTSRRAFFLRLGHGGCSALLERSMSIFSMADYMPGLKLAYRQNQGRY